MEFVGQVLVGIVAVQLLVVVVSQIQQLRGATEQHRLSIELFRRRISAANVLRVQRDQAQLFWNGYRKFVVQRKSEEAENVCSFYLVSHDGKALPQFQPGQYLTFRLNLPGETKPVIRCYSLSDAPHADYYRVTIKRVLPPRGSQDVPPGLVSNYFLDHVTEGDILDVQAPRGHFTLDPGNVKPAVLIGGGVGITPLLSMLTSIAEHEAERDVWLFYGVRNRSEHAFRDVLDDLNQRHETIHVINAYSDPLDKDKEGRDYDVAERISVSLLQRMLDSNNYDYYICGPPPMMSSIIDGLKEWGVPKNCIHAEAFGPASGKALSSAQREKKKEQEAGASPKTPPASVVFEKSTKTLQWDDSFANLLDFALSHDVAIDSGCRAGSCGTCLVAIKSGRVTCLTEADAEPEEGSCLTCISVPAPDGDLVLDV